MKKKIIALLAMVATVSCFAGCDQLNAALSALGGYKESSSAITSELESEQLPEVSSENEGGDESGTTSTTDSTSSDEEETSKYTYTDFTPTEKALFVQYFGDVIPFVPNNEYYVEEYELDYDTEKEEGINYYVYGKTEEEFNAYLVAFSEEKGYVDDGMNEDDGDTWYYFSKDDFYIDISYCIYEGDYIIDVYVYVYTEVGAGDSSGGSSGGSGNVGDKTYTDFTAQEKALFVQYFGDVIPFVPNNEYYVEEYSYNYDTEIEQGINFYAYDNTEEEFNAYLVAFSAAGYTDEGIYEDEYGDTWYSLRKADVYVDICYYIYDENYIIDVYVYVLIETSGGSSDGSGSGGDISDDNLLTNHGKGLPKGVNGVYEVDFTKATYVKNVTEQGYYLGGCPTQATNGKNPAVLVIPVEFSDCTASSKGYSISAIEKAFNGGTGTTDYYSVHDYYYISSYGKLDLDITVLDSWFKPQYTSSYYAKATFDYYGEEAQFGDQIIMDEALKTLSKTMDLSKFDSDENGMIDAVVLINTLDVNADVDFQWAYRYWNIYTDAQDNYYEYDGVSANDYLWASYQFLHSQYDENGNETFFDETTMNTYTYIHEFGHILGADDYYDTAYVGAPMDGYDIMDSMNGDHNAFTKFNYGWLTNSRLVVAKDTITLTLEDFSKNGDTIIIANNWDETLGAYQEYYILVYYTNNGLNSGENGYFSREGVVVYHVNASLYTDTQDGETYYDIYNNNTDISDENGYGTKDNLIEFVKSTKGNYTYENGDTMSALTKDDQGNKIAYTFVVDSLTEDVATITFTKNA